MAIFDIKNKKFKTLELKNYPEKVNFFPHGMKIYKDKYIYVLNHALNSIDGERIEIFELIYENKGKNISHLNYIKSIKLPSEFIGITNGLAVVNKDDIFFTTSYTIPALCTDKANFFNRNLFLLVKWTNYNFNLKMTYLYRYKNGVITKVQESNSWCDNGVASDPINDLIFFYLGYRIEDNLIFDEKNRILNAAVSGNEGYGGLAEIYPDKNYSISYPFYDKITSASAIQINKKVYIVSPHVKYLFSCQ